MFRSIYQIHVKLILIYLESRSLRTKSTSPRQPKINSSLPHSRLQRQLSLHCSYDDSLESGIQCPDAFCRRCLSTGQQFGDRKGNVRSYKRISSFDQVNDKRRGSGSQPIRRTSDATRSSKQYFFGASFQKEDMEISGVGKVTKNPLPIPQIRFERAATPEPIRFYLPDTQNDIVSEEISVKSENQQQLQLPLTGSSSYASSALSLQYGLTTKENVSHLLTNQMTELHNRLASLESENRVLSMFLLERCKKQLSEENQDLQVAIPDNGNEVSELDSFPSMTTATKRYRKPGCVSMDPTLSHVKSAPCSPLTLTFIKPCGAAAIRERVQD